MTIATRCAKWRCACVITCLCAWLCVIAFYLTQEFETGITPERAEQIEDRLRDDVLSECREDRERREAEDKKEDKKDGKDGKEPPLGRVLVHDELPGMQIRCIVNGASCC